MARRRNLESSDQLTLWQSVADVYLRAGDREVDNATMYAEARLRAGVSEEEFSAGRRHLWGGAQTTPVVCERPNRRWMSCDRALEYIRGGATRFADAWINPEIDEILGLERGARVDS